MTRLTKIPPYEYRKHKVVKFYQEDSGGWSTIWSAVYVDPSYCGQCLDELTERANKQKEAK